MSQLYAFEIESSPCPACQSQLVYAPDELRADQRCERCGGVWLEADRLKRELNVYDLSGLFHVKYPSANFCPVCGPIPLEEGTIEGHDGLSCGSCHGVFLYQPIGASPVESARERSPAPTPSPRHPPTSSPRHTPTPSGSSRHTSSGQERSPISAPIGAYVRGPAQIKAAPSASLRDRINTPTTRAAASFVRDLIWFGALMCAIGASLWYWMTP